MDFDELASLININSYTGNKAGVDKNGEIFSRWMTDLGYTVTCYPRETIGDHLFFTTPHCPGKKLLLLGHLDTVFPKGAFESFREDDEWIYGPGVCDMKGGNYVALSALRTVFRQQGHLANVDMLLVSDEETGSDDSKFLTSELAKSYDACLVFEAAGKQYEVVDARKGVATVFLHFAGKAAHAGNHYMDGRNANIAAAKALLALTDLTDLDKGSTVNVGKIMGGIGANTISPEAKLVIDARFSDIDEQKRVMSGIAAVADRNFVDGVSITMTGGIQRHAMMTTKEQQVLLQKLRDITGHPFITEKRGGVSDANTVSAVGVPTLDGFGPYGDGDHTIKERALKSSFEQRISEVTKIVRFYSAGISR
ncbi:Carboxypeptidase G2 [invertebrate metagenome]|uniref:Carboxypeptidase G2 n=1 Tax=invertebrate metagenome TaxID=1711999 RepID=A0A2H9TAC8_9ZZZZ